MTVDKSNIIYINIMDLYIIVIHIYNNYNMYNIYIYIYIMYTCYVRNTHHMNDNLHNTNDT